MKLEIVLMKCQNVFKHATSWNKPEQSPSEGPGALQDAEVGGTLETCRSVRRRRLAGALEPLRAVVYFQIQSIPVTTLRSKASL